ncbi:MAG: PfkB family carbohydrate kinase [Haloarculaceae archaeon]
MPYRDLLDRLEGDLSPGGPVVALPDGSVDTYYRVFEGRETPIRTRTGFAELVMDSRTSSVRVESLSREAGGQAVNLARQVDALDVPVELYGHLDDSVFDSLALPSSSMGTPAAVRVYDFEDDDLMISEDSADVATWSFEDLRAVSGAVEAVEAAAVLAVVNWVSVSGMDAALHDLATLDLGGTTVVLDPGDLTGCSEGALVGLLESLRRLADETRVVTSTNAAETAVLAAAAGVSEEGIGGRLAGLRDRAGLAAAVSHERDRAAAATAEGTVRVPNLATSRVERRTGGGDRFDGALAAALAAGWDWTSALALANACASRFVGTAETAGVDDLLEFLRTASFPDPDDG